MPADSEKIIPRLEELGEMQVRAMAATGGLPPDWNLTIIKWLSERNNGAKPLAAVAQRDYTEFARSDSKNTNPQTFASEMEQLKIVRPVFKATERATDTVERASQGAQRQAAAAERAHTRANVAVIIAIISIIATTISIWVVHGDSIWSAVRSISVDLLKLR